MLPFFDPHVLQNTSASEAEELRTQIRPKLAMILSRMSSVEMSVCRLFRKWIGSHYFSFQIDPLLSDLLVYSALRLDAAGPPGSLRNGFYRLMIFLSSKISNNIFKNSLFKLLISLTSQFSLLVVQENIQTKRTKVKSSARLRFGSSLCKIDPQSLRKME